MATTLQLRRGTQAEAAAFTGAVGELFIDTENNIVFLHDGSTAGGHRVTTVTDTDTNKYVTSGAYIDTATPAVIRLTMSDSTTVDIDASDIGGGISTEEVQALIDTSIAGLVDSAPTTPYSTITGTTPFSGNAGEVLLHDPANGDIFLPSLASLSSGDSILIGGSSDITVFSAGTDGNVIARYDAAFPGWQCTSSAMISVGGGGTSEVIRFVVCTDDAAGTLTGSSGAKYWLPVGGKIFF